MTKRTGLLLAGWGLAALGFAALAAGFWLTIGISDPDPPGRQAAIVQEIKTSARASFFYPAPILSQIDPSDRQDRADPAAVSSARPYIAVVIDDLGNVRAATTRALALPAPITAAFLPDAPYTNELARMALQGGHEVFVHVPMEPLGLADPGPAALLRGSSADTISTRAAAVLDAVPGATGFNNHMGSRFTQCADCLQPLVAQAKARGLAVLDSRTVATSMLAQAASAAGLQAHTRDVFLDHDATPEAVRAQLRQAERVASSRGTAIAIGHPHPVTLSELDAWIPDARARGFTIGPLRDLPTPAPASDEAA